jgi:transposase
MTSVRVERLDHLGLLTATMKDFGLIDMIDARLTPDAQEPLTSGEAVAGMILHGLGFANKPLTLTPQFFAHKPLALLFRPGVHAELFNRFKLGRTLDERQTYGCDMRFSELALAVCAHEGLAPRCHHLDTTSFALSGAYGPESDTQAIHITHGYSKDQRPDLKQAVLERLVAQDGGVPLARKCWDGNAADSRLFQERAEAVVATFARSAVPKYLVADAKLYSEDRAVHLAKLGFLTRIPATLKLVSQVLNQALQGALWHDVDEGTRSQSLALCHSGMGQRWLVVCSQAARERAEKSVRQAQHREGEAITTQLVHLQAKRFETPDAAQAALAATSQSWRYHQVDTYHLHAHKRYERKGRPSAETPMQTIAWQLQAHVRPNQAVIEAHKQHQAC